MWDLRNFGLCLLEPCGLPANRIDGGIAEGCESALSARSMIGSCTVAARLRGRR